MEIFQDGELEAEMHKRDLQANSIGSWWNLFSETYEEMVQSIASPVRAEYAIQELGDPQFSLDTVHDRNVEFVRGDFHLQNAHGEHLACSFWRRRVVRDADPIAALSTSSSSSSLNSDEEKESTVCSTEESLVESNSTDSSSNSSCSSQQPAQLMDIDPCIIYLHGMSSSRKECIYLYRKVLAAGFSLFALDLSGSGLSGGDRVSFGYFEHGDLSTVVDYLYATRRASAVGIWGRDIGSAAALLHVKERMSYRYQTIKLSNKDAKKLKVVEDKEHRHILCIPPVTGLHFRFSKYSASNGDFVLLAIDNVPVQGLSAAACHRLIQRNCKTNSKSHLQGFKKRSSSDTGRDRFIFALAADSAYGDMEQVIWDMLQMITKSAERRSLYFPSAMVTASQKILTNSIGKAGGFSFNDVRLLDAAPYFTLPCLFISASKKDFFMPEHSKALFNRYGGSKSYVQFTGQIDDNRPAEVLDTAISHFSKRVKLLTR
ncbi:Serine aminopeptidase [Phytophthora infestans]|uniref:Serine aminopeptidase n=1 Tax=Phytophthora infestans TaxID=4787 RepID=A0A833WD61_PHYIN|nr:Serine aminopeptidase [Phytophthora infestans]